MKVISRSEIAKTKLEMHKSSLNHNLVAVYFGCAAVFLILMIYLISK